MKRTALSVGGAALALALLLGLAGCGNSSSSPALAAGNTAAAEAAAQITVSASGSVRLTPDKATVSFGVTSQEKTAEAAQSRNSEAVDRVIEVLTGRGIAEASIRTTYYSMYPDYDWSGDGEQRIVGYTVTTTLSVQDQDIDAVGGLLSACVEAGVNRIDSVSFLCSGYDEAYRQALGEAVAAAREKAEALAAAAGKKLGEPVVITEGWQDSSARYSNSARGSFELAAEDAVSAPSFQPGETEITANVTVTYAMR